MLKSMNSHALADKKPKKARSKAKPAPAEEEEEPKEEIHASLTVTIRLTEDALTRVDPSKLEKEAEAKQSTQKSTAVSSICTRPSLQQLSLKLTDSSPYQTNSLKVVYVPAHAITTPQNANTSRAYAEVGLSHMGGAWCSHQAKLKVRVCCSTACCMLPSRCSSLMERG